MLCAACGRTDSPRTQPSKDDRWPGRWCTRCIARWKRHGDFTVMLQAPHGSRETPCTVCGDTPTRKGLCNRHYLRASRHGTTDSSTRDRGRPFDFWVEETEHGLIWTGPQHTVRDLVYGRFQGRTAHRVAYEQAYGPIPEGDYVVDHQPDCPKLCVTPEHLTLYTRGEHTAVGWQRGEITGEQIRQGHARKKG